MEPLSHPIWKKRASCLAAAMHGPMTLFEIQQVAARQWGWSGWLTLNVLASAEWKVFAARSVRGVMKFAVLPGVYHCSPELGRSLRKYVASTIKMQKSVPKRHRAATYVGGRR